MGHRYNKTGAFVLNGGLKTMGLPMDLALLSYCGVAAVSVSSTRRDTRPRDPTPSKDRDQWQIRRDFCQELSQ